MSSSTFYEICPEVLRAFGLNEKSFYLKMLKKCLSTFDSLEQKVE
jgi:hypothetical protein